MEKQAKNIIDHQALFNLSYGLFVLSAKDQEKDNACIINTVTQVTENPLRLTIAVNKANYTHDMLIKTNAFNISVLTTSTPFDLFERYGFRSGRDTDKFSDLTPLRRTANDIVYLSEHVNSVLSASIVDTVDFESHSLFIAEVTEGFIVSEEPSVTYQYYFDNIKPRPQTVKKKGFVCQICGYVYEGAELPSNFICPLCKHGSADFKPL